MKISATKKKKKKKKWKFSGKQIESDIFHISAQNIDCGYSFDPSGSNKYPQSIFLSRNKKK